MKRIALLSLPYLPDYMRNARCDFVSLSHTQWYPIWLGYLGAFLESKGYSVILIDAPAANWDFNKVIEKLKKFRPEFLVTYTGRLSENTDLKLTEILMKKFKCESVLVGPYFSIEPKKTLIKSKLIKYGVIGEFEYPVWELVENKKPVTIKNLIYKIGNRIIVNKPRPYLTTKQLDLIPFVSAFFAKHLNLKNYKAPSELYPFIDIMTGRGCVWGKCSYCLWVKTFIKGSTYNQRSIENVIKELEYIQKNISQVKSVMLQDDTLPEGRVRELSLAILKHKLKIRWSCYARANLSLNTLRLMKKAGCLNLHVGFESASDKILKNIAKGLNKKRMDKFMEDVHKVGLSVHADFAFGFPGESKKTLRETIAWAKELKPDTAQFQLMIPFRGTKFYQDLVEKGNLKNGEPNFPNLSSEEIRRFAKQAYREFYFSWHYLKRVLRHPIQHFFRRFDTYKRAIPAIFWSRWIK